MLSALIPLWPFGAAAAEEAPDKDRLSLYAADGVALTAGLQAASAQISLFDIGAGAGTRAKKDGRILRDPTWEDGFVKPSLAGSLDLPETLSGRLYGGLSVISAWTLGDGDGYALPGGVQSTQGNSSHTDVETAYLGWQSAADAGKTADGVDLSAGRQEFTIGDGFLIGDGHWDKGKDAGYYSGGRLAWRNSAVVSAALLPIRADFFWLKGDKNTGSSAIAGVNAEVTDPAFGTVAAAWMRVLNDNPAESGYPARSGMQVRDFRAQGSPVPGLAGLFLAMEVAEEKNDSSKDGRRQRANSWYGEMGYVWQALPTSPSLGLRQAHFSGDKAGSSTDGTWDPLRYGTLRGWGTWFMGEIVGEYMLFNSNENVQMLLAKAHPSDSLTIGANLYHFTYDQPGSVETASGRTGVASKDFGREIDLYGEWTAVQWLSLSGAIGFYHPGAGAKAAYGAGKDGAVIESVIGVKF